MREIKKRIIEILDAQERKGIATYGQTLEDAEFDEEGHPYDWNMMTIEELIDALQYQVKQNLLEEEELKQAHAMLDEIGDYAIALQNQNKELEKELEINEKIIDNLVERMEELEDR